MIPKYDTAHETDAQEHPPKSHRHSNKANPTEAKYDPKKGVAVTLACFRLTSKPAQSAIERAAALVRIRVVEMLVK